jgi:hypothetical protein
MRLAYDHADRSLPRDVLKSQLASDFAAAVQTGFTQISRNKRRLTPEQYGAALFEDGMSKGWMQRKGDHK